MRALIVICTLLFANLYGICLAITHLEVVDTEETIEAQIQFFEYRDGLIDGVTRAVSQSPDGAMWFAGKKGIARFDGLNWETFTLEHLFIQADINDIHVDRQGVVWIGTTKGLVRFDYKNAHWQTYTEDDGLPGPCVNTICETKSGTIWVGCGTLYWFNAPPAGGVAFWTGNTWQKYTTNDGLVHAHVNDIIEAEDNSLWFATDGGISQFDSTNWRSYTQNDGLLTNNVRSIIQDKSGALWFGVVDTTLISTDPTDKRKSGVSRFHNQTWKNYPLKSKKWGIRSLHQTQDGILWAWAGSALYQYQDEQWHQYPIPLPQGSDYANAYITTDDVFWLPGQNIIRFYYNLSKRRWTQYHISGPPYEDRSGNLWFENPQGGSLAFDGQNWQHQPLINLPVYESPDSTIWTSTPNGIQTYKNNSLQQSYPNTPDKIILIHPTQTEQLWFIGSLKDTSMAVVYHAKTKTWEKYTEKNWGSNIILDGQIEETLQGDLWFKTLFSNRLGGTGLLQFSQNTWTHHTFPTLESNRIYGLEVDSQNRIWAGTLDGLWQFVNGQWHRIIPENNTAPTDVSVYRKFTRIYQAQDNSIWFTCADKSNTESGIYRQLPNGQWQSFTRKNGLPTNNYWYIHETSDGIMWFGAFGYISRYDGSTWSHYKNDLFSNKIHYMFSASQDTTESIWVGRSHTTNPIQWWTTRLRPDKHAPRTEITFPTQEDTQAPSFVPAQGHLLISWHGQDPWNITPKTSLTYSWQIDDNPWSPFSNEIRQAFFNLSKGSHTFRVRTKDLDGNIDKNPAKFQFWVLSPVWQQPWFIGLMVTLIGTIGYLSRRVIKRGHQIHQANQALSEANKQLFTVNLNLTQEIDERARLDTQIQNLQYLYHLRAKLTESYTIPEAIQITGQAILDILSDQGGIQIELDGQTQAFGQVQIDDLQTYQRNLIWSERERGSLTVYSHITLSESQERTLLDETAGQLTRTLEARELHMQLLQSARLVSLGQMAAGVAHELNQPLGGISATAEDYYLRLQDNMPVSTEQLSETFKRILSMVDRMSNTVEHLRVFSRDTSQEPGNPIQINDVIHSSLDIIGTQLKNHGIDVQFNLTDNLPRIIGHPYQLEQIFLNLLGNARDAFESYTPPNTQFKTITISTKQESNTVIATIQDNGSGIMHEHLNRIFEPFYTTKTADKGTGLGLSITYAIVKNHGGDITCTSSKNQGTTFQVKFPIPSDED